MTTSRQAVSGPGPRGYLAIVGFWVVFGLFNASRLRVVVPDLTWSRALLYGFPDGLLWAALTPIPVLLARRFPLPDGRWVRNALVHLAAGIATAVLHSQLDALLNSFRELLTTGEGYYAHIAYKLLVNGFHLNLLIYLLIAGVAMYLMRLESLREGERRTARLRSQLAEARLAALRAQIRPHFLFNALHTAGAMIERDPASGRRILRQLGEILRASLSTELRQAIALRDEIELNRAYLEIEQARFGDRLGVAIEVEPEAMAGEIPALLLQPLVENAVRHGIGRREAGGRVRIEARRRGDRLEILVEDDGPGVPEPSPREGIGLASVRERLRARYGDEQRLEIRSPPGFAVRISIPFVPVAEVAAGRATARLERRVS